MADIGYFIAGKGEHENAKSASMSRFRGVSSQHRCLHHECSDKDFKAVSTFLSRARSTRDAQCKIAAPRRVVRKEDQVEKTNSVIAVFADHNAAEAAVKKLTAAGFEMKNLSLVGKGYHTDEKVVGFYNIGDRMKFWGSRGAFWGASGACSLARCL